MIQALLFLPYNKLYSFNLILQEVSRLFRR